MKDELIYWLWLASLTSVEQEKRNKLAWAFSSPKKVYESSMDRLISLHILSASDLEMLSNKSLKLAGQAEEYLSRYGISLITRFDSFYPSKFYTLKNPPAWFFAIGDKSLLKKNVKGLIAGPERASVKEKNHASRYAERLGSEEIPVVGDLMRGVSESAHESALLRSGSSIAVIPSGINVCPEDVDPKLFEKMMKDGLILTERFLNEQETRLSKDRQEMLLAGISDLMVAIAPSQRTRCTRLARKMLKAGKCTFIPERTPGDMGSTLLQEGAVQTIATSEMVDYIRGGLYRIGNEGKNDVGYGLEMTLGEILEAEEAPPERTGKKKDMKKGTERRSYDEDGLTDDAREIVSLIQLGYHTPEKLLEHTQMGIVAMNTALKELEEKKCLRIEFGRLFLL